MPPAEAPAVRARATPRGATPCPACGWLATACGGGGAPLTGKQTTYCSGRCRTRGCRAKQAGRTGEQGGKTTWDSKASRT